MTWKVATLHSSIGKLEEKIAEFSLPIEVFQPRVETPAGKNGQLTYVSEPIFFDYLFLRALEEIELVNLPNLLPIRWVTFGRQIASISQSEIERVRELLTSWTREAGNRISGELFAKAQKGGRAEIISGVFVGACGTIAGPGPGRSIYLDIDYFNQITRCQVRIDNVRLVKTRV